MIDVRRFARWTTAARVRERTAGGAPVTYGLIALCGAIFLISPLSGFGGASYGSQDALLAAQAGYFERWGVIPAELWEGSPRALLTPFTALFVHGSWLHLLGNLLFLYVFGAMVEERMGRVPFVLFYVGCGYLALVCYAAVHADSGQTLVGASGAISAVLGAFLYLFPKARVTSLFPFLFFLRCASRPGSCWSSGSGSRGGGPGGGRGAGGGVSGACGGVRGGVPLCLGAVSGWG